MLRLPFSLCAGRYIYILNCSFIKLCSDYWDLPISSLWQCDYLTAAKWYLFLITSQCSKIMISSHKGIHFSHFPKTSQFIRVSDSGPSYHLTHTEMVLRPHRPENLPRTSETWAPNKGPPPMVPATLQEGRAKQIIYDIYSSPKPWMVFFFCMFYLPAGSIQQNRQKERLVEKREISFSDLGGFVEQERVTKSKMPSLLPRKTKCFPVVLARVVVPIFSTIKPGWASFGGFATQRPREWRSSQEMFVFCSQTGGFSLITDVLQSVWRLILFKRQRRRQVASCASVVAH